MEHVYKKRRFDPRDARIDIKNLRQRTVQDKYYVGEVETNFDILHNLGDALELPTVGMFFLMRKEEVDGFLHYYLLADGKDTRYTFTGGYGPFQFHNTGKNYAD